MRLSGVFLASALLLATTYGYQLPGGIASPASFRRSFSLPGVQAPYQAAYPSRSQSAYQNRYQPQSPYTSYVYQGGQGYRSSPTTWTSPSRNGVAVVPWASSYGTGVLAPTAVWASSFRVGAVAPSSHWASSGMPSLRAYNWAPWRTSMNGYAAPVVVAPPTTTTTTTTTTTSTTTPAPPITLTPTTEPPTEPSTPAPVAPGLVLPPGVTLPPGVVIPPGFTLPPGFVLPPGGIPPGFVMPPGGLTELFGG